MTDNMKIIKFKEFENTVWNFPKLNKLISEGWIIVCTDQNYIRIKKISYRKRG